MGRGAHSPITCRRTKAAARTRAAPIIVPRSALARVVLRRLDVCAPRCDKTRRKGG